MTQWHHFSATCFVPVCRGDGARLRPAGADGSTSPQSLVPPLAVSCHALGPGTSFSKAPQNTVTQGLEPTLVELREVSLQFLEPRRQVSPAQQGTALSLITIIHQGIAEPALPLCLTELHSAYFHGKPTSQTVLRA